MTPNLEVGLYIFILAGFLGYHVISRVPPLLHTPLMSATNAISGISLIGSLVFAGAEYSPLSTALGFIAVICSSTNVVGGFLITDRMLKMFKKEQDRHQQRRPFQLTWQGLLALVADGFDDGGIDATVEKEDVIDRADPTFVAALGDGADSRC